MSMEENLLLREPSSFKGLTIEEQENLRLVVEFLWGRMIGDIDQILSVMSSNAIFHEQLLPPVKGHDELRISAQKFQSMIGNLDYKIDQFAARGNQVAHYGTISGTFRREFMGLPATGKSFSVAYAEFVIIKNGQIAYVWDLSDEKALLQQAIL